MSPIDYILSMPLREIYIDYFHFLYFIYIIV